ncbi:MAG TPA: WbqC family protein [Bacteroidales bacterium]|nr:WbqC family protein [Bacteroidales bacterium]
MSEKILLSTAYLPPVDYISKIASSDEILIEKNEHFIKQSFRNRCYILSAHGSHLLSVPVLEGSRHKVKIDDVKIDYSKRWQQVHLRAIESSYRNSPYFDFYYDDFAGKISNDYSHLWDLNESLLTLVLKILNLTKKITYTDNFEAISDQPYDRRYFISPGYKQITEKKRYIQVFQSEKGFIENLSILDLIFNAGPEAGNYL